MPPSSLTVPKVTEMSDGFTLFSYFMPHFMSVFLPLIGGIKSSEGAVA